MSVRPRSDSDPKPGPPEEITNCNFHDYLYVIVSTELLMKSRKYLVSWGCSMLVLGVTQPRINDLLRGRISNFSLDALVNIATSLGLRIHIDVEAA